MPRSATFELLQVPCEFDPVVALYKSRKPRRVLEIGCWDGGTLKVWLENAPANSTVVAADLEHRNSDAYEEWQKPSTTLHLLTGKSQDQHIVEQMAEHGPFDWAFIDGDHGDWGVGTDCENVRPLMADNGVMLFHDIVGENNISYPPGRIVDG